ncbi:MAG: WHG domain-containing protein [Trueperaceae bacterium]
MAPRPGLNREKVVDAAVTLLERNGAAGLSLARLAQHFGVRAPSLYNHVEGSEGLRRAVRLRGLQQLGQALQSAAVGRSGREALSQLAHAYRDFVHGNPALYALTVESTEGDDEELRLAGNDIVKVLLAVLTGYDLQGEEAIHAARIVRSALHGFVALESNRGFALATDLEESYERLIVLLHAGLSRAVEGG